MCFWDQTTDLGIQDFDNENKKHKNLLYILLGENKKIMK